MATLGGLRVGRDQPVRIIGILNVSPESFYGKSIHTSRARIIKAARTMEHQGADIIDIGAMSTAPYLHTIIPEHTESARLSFAIRTVRRITDVPISADTRRAGPARDALESGASIINDVSGLDDPEMTRVLARYGPSVILCAHGAGRGGHIRTANLLHKAAQRAIDAGVRCDHITVDPAVGFFERNMRGMAWARRDLGMVTHLPPVPYPVAVSISRKSFLGAALGEPDPAGRLAASLACEAACILGGASIIRTHDVACSRRAAASAEQARKSL